MRFVFFDGPEGWPMEFCAKVGAPRPEGHDHYAIRTPDLDAAEARLAALGAKPVAQHLLAGASGPVHVRFCTAAGTVFELFDEGPFPQPDPAHGWIGLLPG